MLTIYFGAQMKKYFCYRFRNWKDILAAMLLLLPLCILVSYLGDCYNFGRNPIDCGAWSQRGISYLAMNLAVLVCYMIILAPVALPISLGKLFGVVPSNPSDISLSGEYIYLINKWLLVSIYWLIVVSMTILLFRKRNIFIYIILSAIYIISSINWLTLVISNMPT